MFSIVKAFKNYSNLNFTFNFLVCYESGDFSKTAASENRKYL